MAGPTRDRAERPRVAAGEAGVAGRRTRDAPRSPPAWLALLPDGGEPGKRRAGGTGRTGATPAGQGDAVTRTPAWAVISAMERAFGISFAGTRLRDDPAAASRAASLGAVAYTDGTEIGFAAHALDPDSTEGLRTIAHEFAHVAQARGGTPGGARRTGGVVRTRRLDGTTEQDEAELQAEQAADDVVQGRRPELDELSGAGVLRKPVRAPSRPALGPGQASYYRDRAGTLHYVFRQTDVEHWGGRFVFEALRRYFSSNYDLTAVTDHEAFVTEFMTAYDLGITPLGTVPAKPAAEGTAPAERTPQEYDLAIHPALHNQALIWVRLNHPEVVPKDMPQSRAESTPTERTFEPVGQLQLDPRPVQGPSDLPRYVAGGDSTVRATVHFDEADSDRAMLNFFPNHAQFDWTVFSGGKVVDSGPLLPIGEISRDISLPRPGLYRIHVTVSSSRFTGGRKLPLDQNVLAVEEQQRSQEVFAQVLVGEDGDRPFRTGKGGQLELKPTTVPRSLKEQIFQVDAMIAAIDRLRERGQLDTATAEQQRAYLTARRDGLVMAQGQLGDDKTGVYLVEGIFIGREDSRAGRISAVLHRTRRDLEGDKARYRVTLFDLTLSPTEPTRHIGEAEAALDGRSAAEVYKSLEVSALDAMRVHWHDHNDYPYGTVRLAVGLLEDPGVVRTLSIDTYNWKRTAAKVGTGVAAVGGVILIGISAFTAGATAPIGVIILEGVTIAAGAAVAAYNINERIEKTGELKADAQLVLDLVAFVPIIGQLGRVLNASKLLLNGMMLVTLAGTAVAMTVQTKNELLGVEVRYSVGREHLLAQLDTAEKAGDLSSVQATRRMLVTLERQRDKEYATVIGGAAVTGGLLLIQLGTMVAGGALAARKPPGGTGPEGTVPPETQPKPPASGTPETPPKPPASTTPETPPEPPAQKSQLKPPAQAEPEAVSKSPAEGTPAEPEQLKPATEPAPPAPTPLEALQQRIGGLREKIRGLQQRLSQLLKAQVEPRKELNRQIGAKTRELADLKRRESIAAGEAKAPAQEKVARAEEELAALKDRRTELDNDADEIRGEINDAEKSIAKARFPLDRNPDDVAVSGRAPEPALPLTGRNVGGTPNQTAQLEADIKGLIAQGVDPATIRVNQAQVDANGKVQGTNRPDLQYTLGGKRFYIEYEQPSNPRGFDHAKRIIRNDPTGTVKVKLVPTDPAFTPGKGVQELTYTLDNIATLG